jgi:glutathione S-transferase
MKKALRNQGLGRHPPEIIWALGIADIDALGHWLGNRPWGFGDKPTVIDAVLFAFIASITHTPWDFPLKAHTLKHRNLVDHSARMLKTYFPELAPDR